MPKPRKARVYKVVLLLTDKPVGTEPYLSLKSIREEFLYVGTTAGISVAKLSIKRVKELEK